MPKPQIDRLETLIQRELSLILQREVKDQVGFITITGVKVTNELSFIFAYYTVFGGPEVLVKTQESLDRAKGFIKNQLALGVKMRKVPELVFKYDDTFEKGRKIDTILKDIK
jgi:ribosome-binding factor A